MKCEVGRGKVGRGEGREVRDEVPAQLALARQDLKLRAKRFALDVILYCRTLPGTVEIDVIKRQLIRSATSVASNYRASQRARSKADFIYKLGITEEEADESLLWLECLDELATRTHPELKRLLKEADELTAILVTSRKRARS